MLRYYTTPSRIVCIGLAPFILRTRSYNRSGEPSTAIVTLLKNIVITRLVVEPDPISFIPFDS
jgi:hypothetical protein